MKQLKNRPKIQNLSNERFITTDPQNLTMRCIERGWQLSDVMDCVVEQISDKEWTIDIMHPKYPRDFHPSIPNGLDYTSKLAEAAIRINDELGGAGTELKKMLSMFGIKANANCSCNKKTILMNSKGIQWCKDNVDTIVGWLRAEAKRRKLPFADFLGRKLVKMAIKKAEKKGYK